MATAMQGFLNDDCIARILVMAVAASAAAAAGGSRAVSTQVGERAAVLTEAAGGRQTVRPAWWDARRVVQLLKRPQCLRSTSDVEPRLKQLQQPRQGNPYTESADVRWFRRPHLVTPTRNTELSSRVDWQPDDVSVVACRERTHLRSIHCLHKTCTAGTLMLCCDCTQCQHETRHSCMEKVSKLSRSTCWPLPPCTCPPCNAPCAGWHEPPLRAPSPLVESMANSRWAEACRCPGAHSCG